MRIDSRLMGTPESPIIAFPEGGATVAGEAEERDLQQKINALTVSRYGAVSLDTTKKLFLSYDADGDGKISKAELKKLLEDAGIGNWITRGYWVDGVFDELDKDRDNKLTWEEYLVARSKKGTGVTTLPVPTDGGTTKTVDPQLEGNVPGSWSDATGRSGVMGVGVGVAAIAALFLFL